MKSRIIALARILPAFISLFMLGCTAVAPEPLPLERLILHRGDYEYYPGNTLDGIKRGISMGFSYIEVDVRRTRDGTYFLFHDNGIHDNNSIAPHALWNRRPDSLFTEDLSYLCSPRNPLHCAALFDDVITFSKNRPVSFFLDIQNISPQRVAELIEYLRRQHFISKVIFQCPTAAYGSLVTSIEPGARILVRVHHADEVPEAIALRPFAVQVDVPLLTPAVVRKIKDAGSLVVTKTLDSPLESTEGIAESLSRGADLVLTDVTPDRLRHRSLMQY